MKKEFLVFEENIWGNIPDSDMCAYLRHVSGWFMSCDDSTERNMRKRWLNLNVTLQMGLGLKFNCGLPSLPLPCFSLHRLECCDLWSVVDQSMYLYQVSGSKWRNFCVKTLDWLASTGTWDSLQICQFFVWNTTSYQCLPVYMVCCSTSAPKHPSSAGTTWMTNTSFSKHGTLYEITEITERPQIFSWKHFVIRYLLGELLSKHGLVQNFEDRLVKLLK